jgi:curli biogenesis system outer membrane secretion channel CsgG
MKNYIFRLASFVLILTLGSLAQSQVLPASQTDTPKSLTEGLNDLSSQIAKGLAENQKRRIAVVEFVDLKGNVTDLGRHISEKLITKLFQSGKFTVIERQLLNKIMVEQKLSLTGIIDPASAQKLGKLLGVDAIASGSISDLTKTIEINARLISAETGEVFSAASVEITKDDTVCNLMGGCTAIAAPILRTDTKSTPQNSGTKVTTRFQITYKTVTVSIDSLRVLSDKSVVITLRFLNSGTKELLAALDEYPGNVYVTDDLGNKYAFRSSTSIGRARFISIERGSGGWLTCPTSSEVTASITFTPPLNMEKRGNTFSTFIPLHVGTFYVDGHGYSRVTQDGNFDIYFQEVSPK